MKGGWRRRLATGTNAAMVAVLVVVAISLLVGLAERHRLRWDLSADGANTLRPETLAVLDALTVEVEVTAFSAQKRNEEAWYRDRTMRDLLRELDRRSPKLHTRFVDFDADRMRAEAKSVTAYGTVVVEGMGDRVDLVERELFRHRGRGQDRVLEFYGEAMVASAITRVVRREARTVYLLEGHGERRLPEGSPGGLATLAMLFEAQGWAVESLDLLRDRRDGHPTAVPDDASAVLVVGPTLPLAPAEEEALRGYLRGGGSLGFFVDPGGHVPATLESIGVVRPAGVVLDALAHYPHEDRPLLRYGAHPITSDLAQAGAATVVAHAAPLQVRDGLRSHPLLLTSRRGWVERGAERPSRYDPEEDEEGPVVVGVAVEIGAASTHDGRPGRVVAVGDADLLGEDLLGEGPGNATFAVNLARWLLGEDERISRVGRPSATRRLVLSRGQLSMIRWLVVALMPLLAVLVGAAVWAVRRGR